MKIIYFGIYNPDFSRNRVYIKGLKKLGVEIIECRDQTPGLGKYWRLWGKFRAIKGDYDAVIVGYPGHIVVPLAKMLSRKPVIFDALCTLYEGEVISRGRYRYNLLMKSWILLIDWLAAKSADLILVETNKQKAFFVKRFSLNDSNVKRVFTGVNEDVFNLDNPVEKYEKFTVVFRGKFLPEAGVKYIIQSAEILEREEINFLIIGNGFLEKEIEDQIKNSKARNIRLIKENLPLNELCQMMRMCHVSLGQFGNNERLERTIPHKAFESLAIQLPYITGRASGVEELLTDGRDCLMVNLADPDDLAAKVLLLKNNPDMRQSIALNGKRLYESSLTGERLGKEIIELIP